MSRLRRARIVKERVVAMLVRGNFGPVLRPIWCLLFFIIMAYAVCCTAHIGSKKIAMRSIFGRYFVSVVVWLSARRSWGFLGLLVLLIFGLFCALRGCVMAAFRGTLLRRVSVGFVCEGVYASAPVPSL